MTTYLVMLLVYVLAVGALNAADVSKFAANQSAAIIGTSLGYWVLGEWLMRRKLGWFR